MDRYGAAAMFDFGGEVTSVVPYGNGHINDTYAVTCSLAGGSVRFILQRLNPVVFPDRAGLMRNMIAVTEFLRKAVIRDGGDPERECLRLIPLKDGSPYLTDESGDVWRATQFIENTDAYLVAESPAMFASAGEAFGKFMARLGGFDASSLFAVIPRFHDTPDRYARCLASLERNAAGRMDEAKDEIAFVRERGEGCSVITDALERGEVPVRVTHNDTKLNNVLIDTATKEAVCVIDLDTVMPGSMLYDFGDAVRVGCSTAKEDERDLSLVDFDLGLFRAFTEGYLAGAGRSVTAAELGLLPDAARLMAFECGMRFLTDFLDGDTYFKTAYPEHNLVRARTQFKLVRTMERLRPEIVRAVKAAAKQVK